MADFFMGQIMMTGFGFPPKGFAQCNGQLLPIAQNQALFSLLGVNYGGDGRTTFALPDLRSRIPVGAGSSNDPSFQPAPYAFGTKGGVEAVALLAAQTPAHTHAMLGTSAAGTDQGQTDQDLFATVSSGMAYSPANNLVPLASVTVSPSGGGAAHTNLQPYQALNFNIALSGVYPSRG